MTGIGGGFVPDITLILFGTLANWETRVGIE